MKRFKNHKGAALVSVMIAITFISIVATTLLLISLNNYQMKVVNSQSKENFYETEQRLNIVTANLRDNIMSATDATGTVRTLLGGTTTSADYTNDTYKAEKIAQLAFPNLTNPGSTVTVKVNPSDPSDTREDTFNFYGGNFEVKDRVSGKEIVIKDLKVKQVSYSGYENTIKTDLNIYVQMSSHGSSGGGGIGSCSFILDSCLELTGSDPSGSSNPDKSTRINVYGNTIFGKYTYVSSGSYSTSYKGGVQNPELELTQYSVPNSITKTKTNGSVTAINSSSKTNAVIYLHDFSTVNFVSDNNVVFGDIYLDGKSLLNVVKGNFTCYGDIFVTGKSAFVCKGSLNLGPNCGIYRVNGSTITKITANSPANNVIIDSINTLTKADYDKMADHLKLFDNDQNNDGILPNILVKASPVANEDVISYQYEETQWNGSQNVFVTKTAQVSDVSTNTINSMYCYDLHGGWNALSGYFCEFDGVKYRAAVPATNLNDGYANELILVNANSTENTRITQSVPGSTIISKKPVLLYDTHGVCVTKMGDQAFNYILNNDCRFNLKSNQGAITKQFDIRDFFDLDSTDGNDCNSFVNTVFNLATGGDSEDGPTTPTKTAISYTKWVKDVN